MEGARRRALAARVVPGQPDIHGGDVCHHVAEFDALAFERPWTVDHVREDGDAHAIRHHGAYRLDGGGGEDGVRPQPGRIPVASGGLIRLVHGEHDVGFGRHVLQRDHLAGEEAVLHGQPQPAAGADERLIGQLLAVLQVGNEHDGQVQ